MPPVYHLDNYDSCVNELNGTYCYVELNLVSDTPSDLLQMIHEYSEHTSKHFNHTQLHYGICLTKTCKHFLHNDKKVDPSLTLERCLNESLWENYKLKTKISNVISCNKLNDPMVLNIGDFVAAGLFVCLGLLNIIGSSYDYLGLKSSKGHRLFLSFSIKHNIEKLIANKTTDPLRERLKGVNGLRVLCIMLVILAHAPLPIVISTENPHGLEKTYYSVIYQVFYNGTIIVQTFFIITGCLMAYNIRAYSENNELRWNLLPKRIMMRWLRLTPAYAVLLIFTMTWIRFIASGPLWEVAVGVEVSDCHRFGWSNILYLNNYIDNSQCMPHTWYLASDMQLYILGLVVCIFANTSKRRIIVLSALFIIGFIIPPIHTYLQDLDATIIVSPETARNFFVNDPTFNHSYKRGHTNVPSFVLGLALGNVIYEELREAKWINKYKKLGFLYYLTAPLGVALALSGMIFYGDRPRPSVYLRTVVAALLRPLFALLVSLFFIGMVFKFENLYRKITEWSGWKIPARVSYSAYLIHVTIVRIFTGMNSTLSRSGLAQCFKEGFAVIFMSFLIAYPFWLFVEAPLNEAIQNILGLSKTDEKDCEIQTTDNTGKQIEQETTIQFNSNREPQVNINL